MFRKGNYIVMTNLPDPAEGVDAKFLLKRTHELTGAQTWECDGVTVSDMDAKLLLGTAKRRVSVGSSLLDNTHTEITRLEF